MKKDTAEDLINYYILLIISGEQIPTWLLGKLYLEHFISVNSIDIHIEF